MIADLGFARSSAPDLDIDHNLYNGTTTLLQALQYTTCLDGIAILEPLSMQQPEIRLPLKLIMLASMTLVTIQEADTKSPVGSELCQSQDALPPGKARRERARHRSRLGETSESWIRCLCSRYQRTEIRKAGLVWLWGESILQIMCQRRARYLWHGTLLTASTL